MPLEIDRSSPREDPLLVYRPTDWAATPAEYALFEHRSAARDLRTTLKMGAVSILLLLFNFDFELLWGIGLFGAMLTAVFASMWWTTRREAIIASLFYEMTQRDGKTSASFLDVHREYHRHSLRGRLLGLIGRAPGREKAA